MLRWVQAIAVLVTIGSAFWLYRQSYETRRLESAVTAEERRLERLQQDIAVLEAERAYLARPARIEPMARMLGLAPASPDQFGRP
jgi:cell division protein FtsL